jgi:hypothetical protein
MKYLLKVKLTDAQKGAVTQACVRESMVQKTLVNASDLVRAWIGGGCQVPPCGKGTEKGAVAQL